MIKNRIFTLINKILCLLSSPVWFYAEVWIFGEESEHFRGTVSWGCHNWGIEECAEVRSYTTNGEIRQWDDESMCLTSKKPQRNIFWWNNWLFFKLITSPRCGVSDIIGKKPSESMRINRSKRFVIGSSGWKRRKITYL